MCGYETTCGPDVTGLQHTCPHHGGELVRLRPASATFIELFCASCRRSFYVIVDDVADGEVWYCETCR
jgi:hypothetical protein